MKVKPAGRQAKIFKNGIYSALSWVFPIIFAVIVTPVVVKGLGDELYGLYAVVLGFITYSFTFGIGKTATKYVSEYRAAGDFDRISETVSAALWISLAFGIIGVAATALAVDYIISDVLRIPPNLHDTAVAALYLACLTILVTMISQVFQAVIQGLQRFDRFVFLNSLTVFLLNLGSAALVVKGYGVIALLVWNLIVVAVIGVLFYLNARRLMPEFTFRLAIKSEVWRSLVKYSLSIVTYQVLGNILLLFERAYIVRKLGPPAVTFYVVPMMVGFYFTGFIGSLVLVLFPVMNELLTDNKTLARLYQTSSKVIVGLTGFFLVTSIVMGRFFLATWMDDKFADSSYWILVCHVLTFSVLAVTIVVWQMNEGQGVASLNAVVTVVWVGVSIPLMIGLSDQWQSTGVAFARFVGVTAYLALIVLVERRVLGGVAYKFWTFALLRLALGGTLAGLAEWFLIGVIPHGWPALLGIGAVGLSIYTGVLLAAGFLDESERDVIRGTIANLRTGRSA